MRALVRVALSALIALALAACGDAPVPAAPAAPAADATPTAEPAPHAAAGLDTAALRERASAAVAANRLFAPAGDNAAEDYLALRERAPGDASIDTALVDLAPYMVIGAEQAMTAEDFPEAERLIDLLGRMDAEAPAVPRLRDALANARTAAEARAAAEQAEAERLAAESERRAAEATGPASPPAATAPPAAAPALAPRPAAPSPARTDGAPPRPAPTPAGAPTSTPTAAVAPPTPRSGTAAPRPGPAAAPAPRALLNRVQPRFPEAATRRRLQGEVELSVRIRADGIVDGVEVVRANPPGVFDREAVLAVRRWRYAAADAPSEARVVLQFKRD